MFDLAHAFLGDAEFAAQRFECDAFFDEAPFADDDHLALGQVGQGFGEPQLPCRAVAIDHGFFFGQHSHVGQEILPFAVAGLADRGVERAVGGGEARGHLVDFVFVNAQCGRDIGAAGGREAAIGGVAQQRAEAAEVEEQGFLRGGRAGADDRPVAEDVVLYAGADPPGGVGGEAEFSLRLKAGSGKHQADIALLHEVGHGQAVGAEASCDSNDKSHIGGAEFVERIFVAVHAPAGGKVEFMVAVEQRGRHGFLDEAAVCACR